MTLRSEPYGRDVSATDRVQYGRIVSGARLLGEAMYRRLTTARGTLLDDPNYGLSLRRYLGADMTPARLAALPGLIRLELAKDDRLVEGTILVTVLQIKAAPGLELQIDVSAEGVEVGPFALSIAASSVTVALLSLPEAA